MRAAALPPSPGPIRPATPSSAPKPRWCRGRSSSRFRRLTHRLAGGKPELDAPKRPKTRADGFGQVALHRGLLGQRRPQDVARLLFHGALVVGGAYAKAVLGAVVEIADGDARHVALCSYVDAISV